MPKKRKTLPKNFKELIEAKDIERLKAVYDNCEIDAYNYGFDRSTALHSFGIPDELVRWLVEQGADINFRNHSQQTPLHSQASYRISNVAVFLELGADITAQDCYKYTPLHSAAGCSHIDAVKELIAHKADIHAVDDRGHTPLGHALAYCGNIDIVRTVEVAEILLYAGAKITSDMAISVERIGMRFERYRADYNKDHLKETDEGLMNLYTMFSVAPVPKIQTR